MPFANLIKLAFPQRKPKSEQPDQNGHAFQNSQNIRAIENVHGPESGKQNGLHDMHISNEYVNKAFSKLWSCWNPVAAASDYDDKCHI